MALFQYNALDQAGKQSQGTINADSERQARNKLREEGLIPLDIIVISSSSSAQKVTKSIDKKIRASDLSLFTRELCALILAGLEIEQSISSVAEQTENKHLKTILEAIHSKILEGYSLSSGLNDYPKAFPAVYRATIKAGEEAGHLGDVLEHLAEYLDKQELMRQKIIQAIIYPSILTIMSVGIVCFLLAFVTPKIVGIFADTKEGLPLITVILLKISEFLQNYGVYVIALSVGSIFIFKRLLKNEGFKSKVDTFMLKLPLIGKTIQYIETSRFLRTLAILTQATVPILQAFTVASDLVGSSPICKEILIAKDRIKEGATIHAALKKAHYFNPSSLQFIASGENSGNLEEMLMRAANNQERHVQFTINTLLSAFEPILILIMGAIVLFIVLATLLPIFQLSNMIS